MRRPALPRRVLIGLAAATVVAVPLIGAAPAAADQLSCPGGSFNLCIPAQGANEGVTGTAGSTVRAGYDFTVPGSDTTSVTVSNAYEQLTVSCANGATPTQSSIKVPMPTVTYTAPFPQSNGWVPSGNQSSLLTYEGSLTLPDLCGGGTIRVGQPGQMLFAAQVQSNGTSSLSFRSHYNDGGLSKSGSWSATIAVKPTSGTTQTIAGHIYLCNNGTQTTTEVPGGTLGATGPQTVPTQPNPLGPVSVAAGSYTMTETNPPGYQLAPDCGTTSNTQTVVVPSGGAGVGIFYVELVPTTTPQLVATADTTGGEVGSLSVRLPANAGDELIVEVGASECVGGPFLRSGSCTNPTTASVADSAGNTFTEVQKVTAPDGAEESIWTAPVSSAAGTDTVTATPSSSPADMSLTVVEYSGLTGAIDGSGTATGTTSGSNGTAGPTSPASAAAGDLVLGFEMDSGWSTAISTGSGFTAVDPASSPTTPNGNAEFLVESQIAPTAGSYAASAGLASGLSFPFSGSAGNGSRYTIPGVPWAMATIAFAHS